MKQDEACQTSAETHVAIRKADSADLSLLSVALVQQNKCIYEHFKQ